MSATHEDHQKLDRMMGSLDCKIVEGKQKMHEVLDFLSAQMQDEDPNGWISCNNGCMHHNCDVDVWGNCPDMM